jgi:protoporphyrinogen oxidase
VVPALQGVYAGDVRRMSATLVLHRLCTGHRPARGSLRGSVSPVHGMGQLIEKLKESIVAQGGELHFQQSFTCAAPVQSPTVICTSAWSAAKILRSGYPEIAAELKSCESLPLLTVTAFFAPKASDLAGFGCLFPPDQGFTALGVLFANCIFSDRSTQRSETWIFGGAQHMDSVNYDDRTVRELVLNNRQRLHGGEAQIPLAMEITRWPRAIPHYTVEWERSLEQLKTQVQLPLYLHGNYLGNLGLAQIHQRSLALAKEIKTAYA